MTRSVASTPRDPIYLHSQCQFFPLPEHPEPPPRHASGKNSPSFCIDRSPTFLDFTEESSDGAPWAVGPIRGPGSWGWITRTAVPSRNFSEQFRIYTPESRVPLGEIGAGPVVAVAAGGGEPCDEVTCVLVGADVRRVQAERRSAGPVPGAVGADGAAGRLEPLDGRDHGATSSGSRPDWRDGVNGAAWVDARARTQA